MISRLSVCLVLVTLLIGGTAFAEDIHLELLMPGTIFGPGSPCYLDLHVENSGPSYPASELYVALFVIADFWFYPGWVQYPPDIDFETVNIAADVSDTWEILPDFIWPAGTGEFYGAMFYAAVLADGELVSNLAEYTFGWSETPQPTMTPTPPPVTPTPSPTNTEPTPTGTAAPTDFIYIAPGSFTMGSPDTEPCRIEDETQHEVTLTRGFYMQQVEVTRGMWADLKASQPTLPDDPSVEDVSPTMNHPIQYVTWNESILYANLLSLKDGYTRCYYTDEVFTTPVDDTNYTVGPYFCNFEADGYRLPTESEWEYACRAGTTTAFSCAEPGYTEENCADCVAGTHPALEEYCLYCANDNEHTDPVGGRLANPWNLFDMHGNVWEWCWDWYDDYPAGSVTDPTGPEEGMDHMRRGGAWRLTAQQCRSASRFIISPDYRFSFQGIRMARTAN